MGLLISIVIPIYNLQGYISDCLDSVLGQSVRDIEVICVDDGSTDDSMHILEDYAKKDYRLRVIHQENAGAAVARNNGIDCATGKYLCFVDGDDMLAEGALEEIVSVAEHEECEVVTYETELLFEDGTKGVEDSKRNYYSIKGEYAGLSDGRTKFCERIERNEFIDSASLMMIRRKWLVSNGIRFVPVPYYEDSVFAVKCYFACDRMSHIHKRMYTYRVRSGSTMMKPVDKDCAYYRMWQVIETLHMMYHEARNDRERDALIQYASMCYDFGRDSLIGLPEREREKIGIGTDKRVFFYRLLGLDCIPTSCDRASDLHGLIDCIRLYRTVIIYGAGLIGRRTMRTLEKEGLEDRVLGFAVSDTPEESYRDGYRIQRIDEYLADGDVLVVIAASERYHARMIEMVLNCGYSHYQVIDCVIAGQMEG